MDVAEVVAREAALAEVNARWESACDAAVAAWKSAFASWQEMAEAWSARRAAMGALGQEGAADEAAQQADARWVAFQRDCESHIAHMTTSATAPWTARQVADALAEDEVLRRQTEAACGRHAVQCALAWARRLPTGPAVDSGTRQVRSRSEHIEKID